MGTKKIYFASDFHLGTPDYISSFEREKKIVRWLNSITDTAESIFLVGDIFDFWFEYKTTIPKGFTRLLGKLAELSDKGIAIYLFTGNHDLWMFDYFKKEINLSIFDKPISLELLNKKFYIGHGDGLEEGFSGYKILKRIYHNRICQVLFKWIHPDLGMKIAQYWSRKSRKKTDKKGEKYFGEGEWSFQYALKVEKNTPHDFYIFGHRHLPMDMKINENSRFICLGDWLYNYTYAVFDGENLELKKYEEI